MNKVTARATDPSAQGHSPTSEDASLESDPPAAPVDSAEDDDDDDADDFEEFGAYGRMAAVARVKGSAKSFDVPKMRGNRDAGAGRKFNKPLHKDKRGP